MERTEPESIPGRTQDFLEILARQLQKSPEPSKGIFRHLVALILRVEPTDAVADEALKAIEELVPTGTRGERANRFGG